MAASPDTADREIVLRREFAAPRSLVYSAWTDPDHIGRWWGPNGFTTTTHEFRLAPGGVWRHTMHGPDGTDYPNRMTFDEVVPDQRLTYTHDDDGAGRQEPFHVTVTFADCPGGTLLTLRMLCATADQREGFQRFGAVEGGEQMLTRFADHLATAACEIVSTRLFDAPRELVFRAFADPAHLARWWGPAGFTDTIHEFDFRPGGLWRHTMHGPDGTDYVNESEFVEIVAPERIVFDHLRTMHRFLMTMTFADVGGRTRLTWRMRFETAEECGRVRSFAAPANEQNFDRLAATLA